MKFWLTSSSVKAMLLGSPVSRRIFLAISSFVGASVAKWLAPLISMKWTFGLAEEPAILWSESILPPVPSNTQTGDWIEDNQYPGDLSSTSLRFERSKGRNPESAP